MVPSMGIRPAAMRYTEARMRKISEDLMVADIDKETDDHQLNYDDTLNYGTNSMTNTSTGSPWLMALQV